MKLNFAILGAGHIAQKMAGTVDFLRSEINPYAIASRDIEKAEALRAKADFQTAYGSYEEMLGDGNVDLVYIATPNSHHYAHTKAALSAGKHVICEKPFTLTVNEAGELFHIAKEKGLFLTEALWTRFQPGAREIRDVVKSGEIGDVRFVYANFSLAIDKKERLNKPELGGGALLDLGIYPITLTDIFLGLDYTRMTSHATITPGGVDDQSCVTLEYANGAMASVITSMSAAYGSSAYIAGTEGSIDIPYVTMLNTFTIRKGPENNWRKVSVPFDYNGYEYEVRAAIKAINNGSSECEECPWQTTLKITGFMEKLRNEWGIA